MFDAWAKNTLVPLVLRAGLAAIFIYHGIEKVGHNGGVGWSGPMDLPVYQELLVAWGELIGGIAMVLGLLTRLAALGLATIMTGAIVNYHGANGFALIDPSNPGAIGYEYNFAVLVICAAVILLGPGKLAADRIFRFKAKPPG
jgi:putative oxidoreductase